ncbi:MAG: pectinesterase family protein [Ilumatobacteraceae bacterium]
MNVVAVSPTAESYLTVFPGGSARPLASSLNWVAGQAPTPNAVTAAVSTTGTLSFYNHAGTVHLAVDVVGYYLPASSGGTGPAGPVGPPGPAGPAVASVIWVATSGGQYTSVRQALASITDNGPGHRYLVMVGPGTYVEWSTIDLKDYVDLQGSGQDVTTIICNCAATLTSATIAASGPVHSELRNLTVTNSGGGNGPIGVSLTNVTAAMSIVDTTITAANASPFSGGFGLYLTGSVQPHLDALNVYINITGSYAVYAGFFGNIVVVRNSWIYSTAGPSVGAGGSLVRLVASTVNGNTTGLSGRCDLVVDVSGNPFTCN